MVKTEKQDKINRSPDSLPNSVCTHRFCAPQSLLLNEGQLYFPPRKKGVTSQVFTRNQKMLVLLVYLGNFWQFISKLR